MAPPSGQQAIEGRLVALGRAHDLLMLVSWANTSLVNTVRGAIEPFDGQEAASRLQRTYATQVEALRRLRNGGSQFVRVEHVHVNEGGQAVIGNVKAPTGDGS
jgi:hypothetical protein